VSVDVQDTHAPVSIRRAQGGDQERVAALWWDFVQEQVAFDPRFSIAPDALRRWQNDYRLWLKDEATRLFVAERAGTIVGFVLAHLWVPPPLHEPVEEVFIDYLYVEPSARRRGVGSALLDALRTWGRASGVSRLRLGVLAANAEGAAFWARQGGSPMASIVTIELKPDPDVTAAQKRRRLGF
jgi:GNAT superfamily N-acetyltransferase